MFLRKFTIAAACSMLLFVPSISVNAATFSDGEISQVQHFQKEYADLDKTSYDINNLYEVKPQLGANFSAGKIKQQYITTQLAYINYYRGLFGLPAIKTNAIANSNAQKTAAVMAAINADPFVNQHGLPTDMQPNYVSDSLWKLAQDTSETSNLNFNVANQSAGDVITDLITDHYNLTGTDTGHRAWILSTRLSSTGIGAAYGSNGYRYSVQKVLNVDDIFRVASQASVAYPSAGVFPVELAKGKNVAWSLYLSNKVYSGTPKVKITDMDTKKTYQATKVKNYSQNGYGNFKTVITYMPGKTPIISGHQYKIVIGNLYSYTFKLFKEDTSTTKEVATTTGSTYQKGAVQQDSHLKSPFSKTNAKLWASFNINVKNSKTEHYFFDALKKGQWHQNFFLKRVLQVISK